MKEQLTTFPFQQLLSNYSQRCSFPCTERAKGLPAMKGSKLLWDYHKRLSLYGKEKVAVRGYPKTGEPTQGWNFRVSFSIVSSPFIQLQRKHQVEEGSITTSTVAFCLPCAQVQSKTETVPKSEFLAFLICHSFNSLTQVMLFCWKELLVLNVHLKFKKFLFFEVRKQKVSLDNIFCLSKFSTITE